MSVHYKFKSALDYDTVTFDGLHISVGDLKKAIMQQKKIGKVFDFDLQVTNAQTKEVYTDDDCLIPKNASVVVSRVPNGNSSKKSWDRNDPSSNLVSMVATDGSESIPFDRMTKSADLTSINVPEDEKIRAMMSQSTQDYDPSRYVKMKGMSGPIPVNYTCYRCGRAGHWIKNCPTNAADVKRSTGIPRSFMVTVEGPEVPGALLTSTGQYAVPMIDHEAYKEGKKERPPFAKEPTPEKEVTPQIPEELLCMICRDLLSDAVLIPCCGNSYCDECVRQALLDSEEHECPTCHEKDISPDTLIPNRFLRTAVMNFKNETGYTKLVRKIPLPVPTEEPAVIVPPQQPDSTSCSTVEQPVEPVEPIEPVEALPEDRIPSPVSLQEEDSKMSNASANTCDRPDTPVRDEQTTDAPGDEPACDSSVGNGEDNSTDEPVSFAISTITTRGACPAIAPPVTISAPPPQLIVAGPPPPLMSSVPRMKILQSLDPMSRSSLYGDDSVTRRPPPRDVTGLPIRLPLPRPDAPPSSYPAPISSGMLGAHPSSSRSTYTVPPPMAKPPLVLGAPPPLLALPTAQMLSRPPPQHFPQNMRQPPPSLYAHPGVPSSMFRGPPPPLHHTQQQHSQPILRRPSLPPPPPPGSVPPMQPLPPGIRPMHPPPQTLHHSLTHHPPPSAHMMPPVSDAYHHHAHPPPLGMPPHYPPRPDPYYRDHPGYPPSEHPDPYALHHHHQMYDYNTGVAGNGRREERHSRRPRTRTRSRSSSSSSSKSYSRSASSRSRSRSRSTRSHSSRSRSRSYSHSGRSRSYSASLSRSRTRSPYAYHRRSRTRSTSRPATMIRSRSRSKARHTNRHSTPPPTSSSYHRRSRSRSSRRTPPVPPPASTRRHHREYSPDMYYGGARGSGGGTGGRGTAPTSYHRSAIRGSTHHRPAGVPPPPPANPAYDVHRDGRYHDAYHLYEGAYDFETATDPRYDPRYDVERYEEYYRAAQSRHRRIWTPPPPPMVTPLLQHVDDSRTRKTRDYDGRKPVSKKSPSPMVDRRDYRRDEPTSSRGGESRSERSKDDQQSSRRGGETREEREFERRNKDDDRRGGGRDDGGNYDRRANRDESRDDKRRDNRDDKRSEVSKSSSSSSAMTSKQKDQKKMFSSSSSSTKHEQKVSEKDSMKESTKTTSSSSADNQTSDKSKEKRQHKRKGGHHSEEGTATPSKKAKTVKKSSSSGGGGGTGGPVEMEMTSSEVETPTSGTSKKTSKKKKSKTIVAAVVDTSHVEPVPKSLPIAEVTTTMIPKGSATMSNLIDVTLEVSTDKQFANKESVTEASVVADEPNDPRVNFLNVINDQKTHPFVEVEEIPIQHQDLIDLSVHNITETEVNQKNVAALSPSAYTTAVPAKPMVVVIDENVLTAPAPEISKWELYDVDVASQEDDDEQEFRQHHHEKQVMTTTAEKKGLSADIVQRAEKAILQKVMKPATSESSKNSRKAAAAATVVVVTTPTMTMTPTIAVTGSGDHKEEVTKDDVIAPDEESSDKQVFEPTAFKSRDKSGAISIRLDRSKFVEQIRDERPSSSQSSGRNSESKKSDEMNKSKSLADEDRTKKQDHNRSRKNSGEQKHGSKVSRRSRSVDMNLRGAAGNSRHESRERNDRLTSRGDDSRHAPVRRSPSNRGRERDRGSTAREDKSRQSRRPTKGSGGGGGKPDRRNDRDRSRTERDDVTGSRSHHRSIEVPSSSSQRNARKSDGKKSASESNKTSSSKVARERGDGDDGRKEKRSTTDRRHVSIDESKFEPNYDEDVADVLNDAKKEGGGGEKKVEAVVSKAKDRLEISSKAVADSDVTEPKKRSHQSSESSENSEDSKSDDDDEESSVDTSPDKKSSSSALKKKPSSKKKSMSSASDDESSSPDKQHQKKHKKSSKHKKHKKHKHKKSKKARRNSKKESESEGGSGKQSNKLNDTEQAVSTLVQVATKSTIT